jgi:prolyl-tRNA editing enzyme YbaK/EbsC (Cys-tRNA(Pro) deacylase)
MIAGMSEPMTGPGSLHWRPNAPSETAVPELVKQSLSVWSGSALVADIDPELADTAAFCERYAVGLDESANCVVVAGRRGELTRYAACIVLASTRADVNGLVRRRLDARKASFAAMDDAVCRSGMEFGGITPIGVPTDWLILVDRAVVDAGIVVIGSGLRRSKLAVRGADLLSLPNAEVVQGLAS